MSSHSDSPMTRSPSRKTIRSKDAVTRRRGREEIELTDRISANDTPIRAVETQTGARPNILNEPTDIEPSAEAPRSVTEEITPAVQLSFTKQILIGIGMMLCYFVASASTTAVVLVIPSIARDFGINNLEAQWVASSYGLAYGCTLLVAGRLADIFGRKLLFVGGMVFYTICSLISPFIPNWIGLCVVRAFSGLGLAIASPAAFGIVATCFQDDHKRTMAFSALALGNPMGALAGTLLGGSVATISEHSWSYVYFLLSGVSIFSITVGALVVPGPWLIQGTKSRIDWIGAGLVTVSISLFAFSLTQSGVVIKGWKNPYIPTLFVLSILLFALFCTFEHHLEYHPTSRISRGIPPIVKTSLLTRQKGRIAAVTFSSFAVFTCVPGWIYLTTVFYQDYKGLTPLNNAVHLLPSCISGMFAAGLTIYLLPRLHPRLIISLGAFLSGLACLLFAVEPTGTNYWACEMLACLCISFGADMGVGVGSVLISDLVKEEEQSVAGAIFQTSVQIASAFGVCLSSLLVGSMDAEGASKGSMTLLKGLRDAFGMNVAWAWIVPLIMLVVPLEWNRNPQRASS